MSELSRPKKGSKYYTIFKMHNSCHIEQKIWEDSELDKSRFENQNYFRTKNEAKTMLNLFGDAW